MAHTQALAYNCHMNNTDNNQNDALIHLRVSRELKGRWVAQSRAENKKLTDWIVERVERVERCDDAQKKQTK